MLTAVKFAISVLALAGAGLAQDGLSIDNKHKERLSTPEAEKIYSSACSSSNGNSTSSTRFIPRPDLYWGPTRTRYGSWDEKSGLLNGTLTPSHREAFGSPLRI
jgi:hypothetical protein